MLEKREIPIVSLFSGAGGLDLGFEQAGFKPVVGYDIYSPAVETYNYNRGKPTARIGDLSTLDAETIISNIQDDFGEIAIEGIIGGPPCQAFSRSNVYVKDDDARRTLPGKFAQVLKGINEHYGLKFFVFENVQGLTFKRHTEEFARFRFLFEEAGFYLHEALLNARDYGVPQDRPRVFIVGINKNILQEEIFTKRNYQFPPHIPGHYQTVQNAFESAFGNLPWPNPAYCEKGAKSVEIPFHPNHWTMVPRSAKFEDGTLKEGEVKGRSFRVLAWNKPSWTVAYGHREIHIHPTGTRRLSIFEAMILQGFPPNYVLRGNFSAQVKLVSDAVPPPLAYNIAQSIKDFLAEREQLSNPSTS